MSQELVLVILSQMQNDKDATRNAVSLIHFGMCYLERYHYLSGEEKAQTLLLVLEAISHGNGGFSPKIVEGCRTLISSGLAICVINEILKAKQSSKWFCCL